MKIVVKKCNLADINQLQQICQETFRDTFGPVNSSENVEKYIKQSFSLHRLTEEIKNPNSAFYFAMSNDKAAGYLKVNIGDAQTEEMGPEAAEIQRIYVRKSFKRQGIGSILMRKSLEVASKQHRSQIWLGVWEKNLPGQALYHQFGFKQTGEHVFTMGDKPQRDLIMSRTI